MSTLFLRFASISLTTGFVILMVLLLAPIFRKYYSAKWKYWVWLVLALRLLIPITIPASYAAIVVNVPDGQQGERMEEEQGQVALSDVAIEEEDTYVVQDVLTQSEQLPGTDTANQAQYVPAESASQGMLTNGKANPFAEMTSMNWLVFAWVMGMAIYALYYLTGHLVFQSKVNKDGYVSTNAVIENAVHAMTEEMGISRQIRILVYANATSPMMIGLLHPMLILPKENYTQEELHFILRHELTHCHRNDLWYKLLLLVANGVHWYNPIVWLMCREANADLEQSCDDAVLQDAAYMDRKLYTMTILNGISEQVRHENSLSTYFYGGKEELKQRFSNILDMKKRRFGKVALVAVVLCVTLASGLLACSNGNVQEDSESGAEANETNDSAGLVDTTNTEEVQETYEGPGPDKEEVYEELVVDDEYDVYGKGTYQAMWDGIYRISEDGSRECVYEGHVGTEPHMAVHNGILYFKTYLEWQDGYMDWIDTGIRMVNLATLQKDIVDIGENRIVKDFYIENESGLAVIIDMGGKDGYLFIPFDNMSEAWNPPDDEMMRELWKLEDTGLAIQTAKKLIENVGTMEEVSFRTEEGVTALMDMELDGEPERVTFDGTAVDPYSWRQWNQYELSVNGEKLYEGEGAFVYPRIWFLSLDGKGLFIAIYDDGPSSDPTTTLLQYADGEIIEVGKIDADILTCEIASDGVIHGSLRKDVIQTDWIRASWQLNEENMLEQIPTGDIVEFRSLNEVELVADIILVVEPNGEDTFVVEASEAEPQTIVFTRATADNQWIELTMADGEKGWLALSDYTDLADGRSKFEVFRNLNMAD